MLVPFLITLENIKHYLKLWSCHQFSLENNVTNSSEGEKPKMVGEVNDGHAGEDHEPEPEEDVDLLIEYIDRENTLYIMSLVIHIVFVSTGIKYVLPVLTH